MRADDDRLLAVAGRRHPHHLPISDTLEVLISDTNQVEILHRDLSVDSGKNEDMCFTGNCTRVEYHGTEHCVLKFVAGRRHPHHLPRLLNLLKKIPLSGRM